MTSVLSALLDSTADTCIAAVYGCSVLLIWFQIVLRSEPDCLVIDSERKHRVASKIVCQPLQSHTGKSVAG